jgi:hypothetical protein
MPRPAAKALLDGFDGAHGRLRAASGQAEAAGVAEALLSEGERLLAEGGDGMGLGLDELPEEGGNEAALGGEMPFVPCAEQAAPQSGGRQLVKEGDGFDVYVDGLRFLPSNVSVCKVATKLMNSNLSVVNEEVYDALPGLADFAAHPHFGQRVEYRSPHKFNPTGTLVLQVVGVDSSDQALRVVGYALLAAFSEPDQPTVQPADPNAQEYRLNAGHFQLPLYQVPPAAGGPNGDLTAAKCDGMPRVPCATLLVRVLPAAKGAGGLATLQAADVPEEEWAAAGLLVPMPKYDEGAYVNSGCLPSSAETALYRLLAAQVRDY